MLIFEGTSHTVRLTLVFPEILQGPGAIIILNTTSRPPSSSVFPKPNHSLFPGLTFTISTAHLLC